MLFVSSILTQSSVDRFRACKASIYAEICKLPDASVTTMFTKESSGNVKNASDSSYVVRQHRMILFQMQSINLYTVWIAKWLPPLSASSVNTLLQFKVWSAWWSWTASLAIAPRLGGHQSHVNRKRCIVTSLAIHLKRIMMQSRQGRGQAGQGRHGVSRQRGLPWRVLQPHLRDLHWYHRKKAHKLKQMKYGYYRILLNYVLMGFGGFNWTFERCVCIPFALHLTNRQIKHSWGAQVPRLLSLYLEHLRTWASEMMCWSLAPLELRCCCLRIKLGLGGPWDWTRWHWHWLFSSFFVWRCLLSWMEFTPKFPVPLVLEILTRHQVTGTTLKKWGPS